MSISFDAAIGTLRTMFPEWDEDTLSTLLVANNYHVERTIETVLNMSGDTSVTIPAVAASSQSIPSGPSAAPSDYSFPAEQRPYAAPSSAERRQRGKRCDLPDDFLRPPGYPQGAGMGAIIADEELALMLQNELFQREVRGLLGEDFMPPVPARRASAGGAGAGAGGAGGAASDPKEGGDLGLLKALGSMGTATKRSLSQLAQRFASSSSSSGTVRRGSRGGGAVGEAGTAREFRPLVESSHLDEEDDTEVISFERGNRSQHVLQGAGGGAGGGLGAEEEDSENPLIAQGGGVRNLSVAKKAF